MNKIWLFLLAVSLVISTAYSVSLEDDFNDGVIGSEWTVMDGSPVEADGVLTLAEGDAVISAEKYQFVNVTISAKRLRDLRPDDPTEYEAGFMGLWQDWTTLKNATAPDEWAIMFHNDDAGQGPGFSARVQALNGFWYWVDERLDINDAADPDKDVDFIIEWKHDRLYIAMDDLSTVGVDVEYETTDEVLVPYMPMNLVFSNVSAPNGGVWEIDHVLVSDPCMPGTDPVVDEDWESYSDGTTSPGKWQWFTGTEEPHWSTASEEPVPVECPDCLPGEVRDGIGVDGSKALRIAGDANGGEFIYQAWPRYTYYMPSQPAGMIEFDFTVEAQNSPYSHISVLMLNDRIGPDYGHSNWFSSSKYPFQLMVIGTESRWEEGQISGNINGEINDRLVPHYSEAGVDANEIYEGYSYWKNFVFWWQQTWMDTGVKVKPPGEWNHIVYRWYDEAGWEDLYFDTDAKGYLDDLWINGTYVPLPSGRWHYANANHRYGRFDKEYRRFRPDSVVFGVHEPGDAGIWDNVKLYPSPHAYSDDRYNFYGEEWNVWTADAYLGSPDRYPDDPNDRVDLNGDGLVDFEDFAKIMAQYGRTDCIQWYGWQYYPATGITPGNCGCWWANIHLDEDEDPDQGDVDLGDVAFFIEKWLDCRNPRNLLCQ